MIDTALIETFPEAIATLIRGAKLPAAEQRLLKMLPSRTEAEQAGLALAIAQVWFRANDLPRTRRWLARMPFAANARDALRAARLARGADDVALAFDWYEHALRESGGLLTDELDRLHHGQSALAAAERARIPHGRQGSWKRHLVLLDRAETVLANVAEAVADPDIRQQAEQARQRASKLLGAKSRFRDRA